MMSPDERRAFDLRVASHLSEFRRTTAAIATLMSASSMDVSNALSRLETRKIATMAGIDKAERRRSRMWVRGPEWASAGAPGVAA